MSERQMFEHEEAEESEVEQIPISVVSKQEADKVPTLQGKELRTWVSGKRERLDFAEEAIAAQVTSSGSLTTETLRSLGELEQERDVLFVNNKLAWALETDVSFFSPEVAEYFAHNIASTDPEENFAFHKILDFIHSQAVTIQDPPFSNKLDDEHPYKQGGFFLSFCYLAEEEIGNARNYLIKRHLEDILETWNQASSKKPNALHGVAGGTSDQTIYTFSHVAQAYENRLQLGINEGYPIGNPVLQLSPGYYGFYKNGAIEKVYKQPERGLPDNGVEADYISRNNPEDEYIYDEINSFSLANMPSSRRHPSNGLSLLQTIWDFESHLRASERRFYYDMSRITNPNLHPMIVGDLYTRNQQYRHETEGRKNKTEPIPYKDFMRQLYPAGELTEEKLYHYKNLSRLHMRKKIEDDFGLDLSEYDLWTQRAFLEFLETRDIENVERLQKFVKEFGAVGLKTFLSLEYGPELGDDIVALGEKLPKAEAEKIFAKYGELVDTATEAETSLAEHFPEARRTPELVTEVRESLLRRGRDMLVSFSAQVKASGESGQSLSVADVERELSLLRGNAALFAAGFKELSKRGEKLNLAEIKSVQFEAEGVGADTLSPTDRERMRELYRLNYAEYPEFQKMVVEKFDEALERNLSKFYVLRYRGEVEGFYRLGVTDHDAAYFGAFNMNPKYVGSGLGEALMQQSLDVEAKDFVIEANCIADKSIAANYIERGFVGTHTKQVHEPHLMYITRNDNQNENFLSKKLSDDEIIRTCATADGYLCKQVGLKSVSHQDLALLDERPADGTRYVLTRYIRDKNTQSAYLVFEKVTEAMFDEYSRPTKSFQVSQGRG